MTVIEAINTLLLGVDLYVNLDPNSYDYPI